MTRSTVAVLGGAVGGLAAAERFAKFADVTLFERQLYDTKRVNCGEAINDAALVPLAKTPENGFLNPVEGFDIHVYPSRERDLEQPPLGRTSFPVGEGYITDRNVVERQWAARLREKGVDVREGENVLLARYRDVVDSFDYVVDATGQPAVSLKAAGATDRYTGDIVALNADVEATYEKPTRPDIYFEGYVGYFWVFPKSPTRANVGIGWADTDRPESYIEALWTACDRFEIPRPPREDVGVYTIPRGPSLDPSYARFDENVFLVGDAAGLANRYQGEGIVQAIRSSYLLADLVETGRKEEYPEQLYRSMRAEYRLASLMLAVWTETEDPKLLAEVAEAIDGLTVDDVTRHPRRVVARLARHPTLLTRLVRFPGIRRTLFDAYTDRWEFSSARDESPASTGTEAGDD